MARAQRSAAAGHKAATQELEDGSPMHSVPTLLRTLATVCRNPVVPKGLPEESAFEVVTQPTELQSRAWPWPASGSRPRSQNSAAPTELSRTPLTPRSSA